jgi:hypothetical protein
VQLLVELAGASPGYDRDRKIPGYARAGIPEVWLVNLVAERIEVYADPRGDAYAHHAILGRDATLAPQTAPRSRHFGKRDPRLRPQGKRVGQPAPHPTSPGAPPSAEEYLWGMTPNGNRPRFAAAAPGADLIREGLDDLATGRESIAALVVSVGAPRLRQLGLAVPSTLPSPEHRLYALLAAEHPDSAHSRYNALIRRLVSFERALECAR